MDRHGLAEWDQGGAQRGYTFIELLVVATIILILASAIMPLARVTATRQREAELRRALREMRTAIDKFKDAADPGQIGSLDLKPAARAIRPISRRSSKASPPRTTQTGRKLKFLRRVPVDPMTHDTDWGMRSYQDDAGRDALGRPERLRRLHDVRRHGARRHEIQRLVNWVIG